MNFIRDGYVIDDLASIHEQRLDIEIDWLAETFLPASMETERIRASIEWYRSGLKHQLARQNVDLAAITALGFHWPDGERKFMTASDDRGKAYKIYINESK
ncbi:hypothetical protein [Pandoraea iniqua]|nr:hypothetical protein [Pandoraea iniqua]